MSHQVIISDEAYQTLATVATERGQSPEELIEAWAVAVQQRDLQAEARYQTFEEFFTDLGMTVTEIQSATDNADL